MGVKEIESRPEVQQAAQVLRELEGHGLQEASIAAGWTRSLLTGAATSDIDVSYVGSVHYIEAQKILRQVLRKLKIDEGEWDIDGIWNSEMAYGVKHTVDDYLLYYLNSIDSVYLASDGRLHDPTGFGFRDAKTKTLRINEYDLDGRTPTSSEEVNVCLENCRRLAKFGWTPTARSEERIRQGVGQWGRLTNKEKSYFHTKLKKKFQPHEVAGVRGVYEKYGWGFVFDIET